MMRRVSRKQASAAGFTLAEVVIALGIMGVVFSGIILAYIQSSLRAEWSGYSLAAQGLAVQQMEQVRSASWDTLAVPPVDQIGDIPRVTGTKLDLPYASTNWVYATNYLSITNLMLYTNPPVVVRMIRVDTVWPWHGNYFTNTIVTYRAPEQ